MSNKQQIGFDVKNLHKMAKALPHDEQSDKRGGFTKMQEFVIDSSGHLIALQTMVTHLLETQSAAQQEKLLELVRKTIKEIETITPPPPAGERLKQKKIKDLSSFIKFMRKES